MSKFRLILYPFAVVYDGVTRIKNFLYNRNILHSNSFDIPLIVIGNLAIGGTGKTPHTEYIARLLRSSFRIAVLSRGYGRKTSGYFLATPETDSHTIGDEPLQIYNNVENIDVAVCEDRSKGVEKLQTEIQPEIVILDDAFQHRKIQGSFYILLSTYDNLFYKDFVLPAGNLRETAQNKERANIIVVTKCPDKISSTEHKQIINRIQPSKDQKVFFSKIQYQQPHRFHGSIEWNQHLKILLVTGIVNPQPLKNHLQQLGNNVKTLSFKDHHSYASSDIETIYAQLQQLGENAVVVTTSKDRVKLQPLLHTHLLKEKITAYEISITIGFLFDQENEFKKTILEHVRTI
ncbi:tetraacyldisaccharide 4'-kinase [bacterium SCSIO 12643]|nr:tetraacyldisaccharide 4'-kinase [bacterium SCSIO 12643]